jgi:uncharacterized protein (DUF169 family)
MRKPRTDLSVFSQFEFQYPVVAVKYLFARPEGIEQLDKRLPFCQMIREVQERKTPFYIGQENEDCFGTAVLGMTDVPPFATAGIIGESFEIYQEARANGRLYQHIPKQPKGTVNFVAYSLLDQLAFEPDLLLIMADTSQAEILLRAVSYATGEPWESKNTGVLGCAWIYNYPFQTGKVNYVITGFGFGSKAKGVFPEGLILLSIPWDKIPTVVTGLNEMQWVLPAYQEGRDDFLKHEARVIEEAFRLGDEP